MKDLPVVLLVEDSAPDAFLFKSMVESDSIPIILHHVPDGHEAMRYLKGESPYANRKFHPLPGMVVMDLHMPGMSGMALLRWIRKQESLHGLPVVVCSGSDYGASMNQAMANGADIFVIKGSETLDLIHLMHHADLNWQSRAEAA